VPIEFELCYTVEACECLSFKSENIESDSRREEVYNTETDSGYLLFPNPFFDNIKVEVENFTGIIKLELIDLQGKVILRRNLLDKISSVSTSEIPDGVYIARLSDNNGTHSFKIIKHEI